MPGRSCPLVDGLQVLAAHHGARAAVCGCPAAVVDDRGDLHQVFARRTDAGYASLALAPSAPIRVSRGAPVTA